jgi:hypothetical protein
MIRRKPLSTLPLHHRRNMRVSGREALLAGQRVARWLVRSQVTLERVPRLAPLGEPWRAAQGKGVNRKIIKTPLHNSSRLQHNSNSNISARMQHALKGGVTP